MPDSNPAAPERNLHHTREYYSQEDWENENLGKPGEPAYNYPGEPVDTTPINALPERPF